MQLPEYEWVQYSKANSIADWKTLLNEALSLMEEVVQHLGGSSATNTWLLTPVSPDGKKPIDYLVEGEYATFRGFLLRTQTSLGNMFHPLTTPSSRVHWERSLEEREAMREQLRPKAWREDDDENTSD